MNKLNLLKFLVYFFHEKFIRGQKKNTSPTSLKFGIKSRNSLHHSCKSRQPEKHPLQEYQQSNRHNFTKKLFRNTTNGKEISEI